MADNPVNRATLRRQGHTLYTVVVCRCGKTRTFTSWFDIFDDSPNVLVIPIDKLNYDVKESGWLQSPTMDNDWCPACRVRKLRALKRRGISTRETIVFNHSS